MTSRTWTIPALVPLPFQIRPIADEGRDEFVERLAEANCIKTHYLRKILREPPEHRGHVQWERLAAITGRDPVQLSDILGHSRCKGCGIILPLDNKASDRRTCSAACRTKSYRQRLRPTDESQTHRMIVCAGCGRSVEVLEQQQPRRYCSRICRQLARKQHQRELGQVPIKACEACGKVIGRLTSRRWCSERCSDWAWRKRNGFTTAPAPDAPYPGQPKTCAGCGGPLIPGSRRIRLTCSPTCKARASRRRRQAARLTAEVLGP